MAKKRGLVDAALTVSGGSEKFTQDIEDFAEGSPAQDGPSEEQPAGTTAQAPETTNGGGQTTSVKRHKWLSEYDPASQQAWLKEACKYFSITDAEFWVLVGAKSWEDLKISSPELRANIGDAIEVKAGKTEKAAAQ